MTGRSPSWLFQAGFRVSSVDNSRICAVEAMGFSGEVLCHSFSFCGSIQSGVDRCQPLQGWIVEQDMRSASTHLTPPRPTSKWCGS